MFYNNNNYYYYHYYHTEIVKSLSVWMTQINMIYNNYKYNNNNIIIIISIPILFKLLFECVNNTKRLYL